MLWWIVAVGGVLALALLAARRWVTRLLVARASLHHDGLGRHLRLVPTVARFVLPVQLTGVGDATARFDTTLLDQRPDLDLAGVPAGTLRPVRDSRSYLLVHPAYLEFWCRAGLSFRRVAALPRDRLHDLRVITHDPDGIGATDEVYRDSEGTLEVYLTPRLRLFFLVLVRPDPRLPGPGSYPGRD